jgi:serine O-acetyltransferase
VPEHCTVVGVPAEIVRIDGQKIEDIDLDHGDLPDPVRELKKRVRELQKEVESLEAFHKGQTNPKRVVGPVSAPSEKKQDGYQ